VFQTNELFQIGLLVTTKKSVVTIPKTVLITIVKESKVRFVLACRHFYTHFFEKDNRRLLSKKGI